MYRSFFALVVLLTVTGWSAAAWSTAAWAQRGGDRGSDRSGGEGSRESRWGGRSGDEGGRSRFGGGFPGGGGGFPGGGAPPWGGGGGFSRGGDSGRGGFGGGGFGGGGFGGGGFNPADMVRRFDRNNNNMIEPDEAQGPAQFFLQRMAQNNPKIDLSKPIPIDLLTGEMDRMRGGRGGDEDEGSASNEPQLLIPDFSLDYVPPPVATFGVASAKFTVKVTERDLKEAEDRMRRYDQNRDGSLSAEELRGGRWGDDDPMQFDRNRDGKLTATELAVRYANRRIEESQRGEERQDDRRSRWGGWGGGGDDGWTRSDERREDSKEEAKRFGDAKSYRLTSREEKTNNTKGLPDFFARSDADGDGQVFMHEFSSSWNDDTLAEFLKWDLNADGAITARECLAAIEKGARVSSSTPGGGSSTSSSSSTAKSSSSSVGSADAVQIEWAKRQIAKYDQNNDGELSAAEWEKMLIKPTGADTNGDGVITVDEYAAFRAKK